VSLRTSSFFLGFGLAVFGCASDKTQAEPWQAGPGRGGSASGGGSSGGAPGAGGVAGPSLNFGGASANAGTGATCTADFAETELQPVYLAFDFDVSGSMGKLDKEWHDPELKWKPVVAATRAFFEDKSSSGIRASLTFFPADDDKCEANMYETPDVEATELPSTAFGRAMDDITPESAGDWRGGTPTLAVLTGTIQFLSAVQDKEPDAKYALVLVSDGYPEGCDDDEDDIDAVADKVAEVKDRFPTYVIGVSNPPSGPDTVSNLDRIALAGGTEHAYVIKTGDQQKTISDFKAAIDRIRGAARSCEAMIPSLADSTPLDPGKVNVSSRSQAGITPLSYDAECRDPSAWRYDNPTQPSRIVLCEQACAAVQTNADMKLSVEFGCETREVPH